MNNISANIIQTIIKLLMPTQSLKKKIQFVLYFPKPRKIVRQIEFEMYQILKKTVFRDILQCKDLLHIIFFEPFINSSDYICRTVSIDNSRLITKM